MGLTQAVLGPLVPTPQLSVGRGEGGWLLEADWVRRPVSRLLVSHPGNSVPFSGLHFATGKMKQQVIPWGLLFSWDVNSRDLLGEDPLEDVTAAGAEDPGVPIPHALPPQSSKRLGQWEVKATELWACSAVRQEVGLGCWSGCSN